MITKRQEAILSIVKLYPNSSAQEILGYLSDTSLGKISKITLIRDLGVLIKDGLVERVGTAKATKYRPIYRKKLLEVFDATSYFEKNERIIPFPKFNFEIFNYLNNIFDSSEIVMLDKINSKFRKNFRELPKLIVKKELERLTIEFSWKSSQIEGNTYSLLDTERLIKDKIHSNKYSEEEACMILNHKNAMDFIVENLDFFKELNSSKIEQIHDIIVKDLDVSTGIRTTPVGIVGTDYKPLDNKYQIQDAMKMLCDIVNSIEFPIEKALIAIAVISYIQPFEDGNKRTSRLMGNAILLANGFCPLSYRSVDEIEYKKSMILFYEQNSIAYFKELFVTQFENAIDKYF